MTGRSGRRWWYASALLGVVGGVLWWAVATPPMWVITEQGATMSENQSVRQFGTVLDFVIVGAVICFLFGVAMTLRVGEHWWLVPVVAAMSGFAAGVAWLVGKLLGPDGPSRTNHPPVGTRVPDSLTVGTAAPFVAWAVFGVAGVLIGTWLLHRRAKALHH